MKSTLMLLAVCGFLLGVARSASITSQDRADAKSTSDCQSCEYIMRFIRFQILNQAQSVNDVKEKMKTLFKIIPATVQNDEYLSNVEIYVRMIRNGKDPQSICQAMSKCSTEQVGLPRITECQVCTAVVDLIKFELTISNATVQVIIKAVEALCAILGDVPVYQECKLILDELNQIIQWIEQKLTPTDICVRLGFCNKTMAILTSEFFKAQLSTNSSNMLCDLCKMVVNMLDNVLKNIDNNLDDAEDELNNICSALGDLADECESVVDMVIDDLKKKVEYLDNKLDPSATCKALHLCSSSLTNV